MLTARPATKILVDGGNPDQTLRVRNLLGFVDGQTSNPTFVAKNPDVQKLIASGRKLGSEEQKEEYKTIVRKISPLVGTAGVSIEVFADFDTSAEQMLAQGEEMFAWIPNAYIKYPCIHEGLRGRQVIGRTWDAGEHDALFPAGTSRRRIRRDQGRKRTGLPISVCREAG